MSKEFVYPCVSNGMYVTSIIQDRIREYMMQDGPHPNERSIRQHRIELSTSVQQYEISPIAPPIIAPLATRREQEIVSTTAHSVQEENEQRLQRFMQNVVSTSALPAIGASALPSLHATNGYVPVASTSSTSRVSSVIRNTADPDKLFITSSSRDNYTLHDMCGDYIQLLTVSNNESSTPTSIPTSTNNNNIEEPVSTTSEDTSMDTYSESDQSEMESLPFKRRYQRRQQRQDFLKKRHFKKKLMMARRR